MKITINQLKQIIKEEYNKFNEATSRWDSRSAKGFDKEYYKSRTERHRDGWGGPPTGRYDNDDDYEEMDPYRYSDLTDEEIEELIGPDGLAQLKADQKIFENE